MKRNPERILNPTEESDCSSRESPRFRQITPALEFACWVVVLLVPLLRLINGAAVTDDQFTIQVALATLALVGALVLRYYNWRQKALRYAGAPRRG